MPVASPSFHTALGRAVRLALAAATLLVCGLTVAPSGAEELPVLTDSYAQVNGVRLHYVGAGKGKLLLFLHGFPEFWYAWKRQLQEFGRDFHAVAPDLRGYNLSEKPAAVDAYRMPQLVADVGALADQLGEKRFVLVAHDWGGVVAWAFAAMHPERVEKLVIINAPHPNVFQRELRDNPAQQRASQYMLLFRSPDAEKTLSANNYAFLAAAVLGEGLKTGAFTEEDRQEYLKAWSQPGALTGGLNYYRAAGIGPPEPGGKAPANAAGEDVELKIKIPTLVIWGEKDQALTTGNLNGLDQYVPQLTVKRLPAGSHWVVHEQPELVNRLIRDFVQEAGSG